MHAPRLLCLFLRCYNLEGRKKHSSSWFVNGEFMSVSGHICLELFSHIFKETFNNSTNNGDVSRCAIGFVPKTRRAAPSIARRRADPRDPNRAVGIAIGASRIPGRPPARAFASPNPQR